MLAPSLERGTTTLYRPHPGQEMVEETVIRRQRSIEFLENMVSIVSVSSNQLKHSTINFGYETKEHLQHCKILIPPRLPFTIGAYYHFVGSFQKYDIYVYNVYTYSIFTEDTTVVADYGYLVVVIWGIGGSVSKETII
jgi:hypothetical protein